jgi:hypothetical protein
MRYAADMITEANAYSELSATFKVFDVKEEDDPPLERPSYWFWRKGPVLPTMVSRSTKTETVHFILFGEVGEPIGQGDFGFLGACQVCAPSPALPMIPCACHVQVKGRGTC